MKKSSLSYRCFSLSLSSSSLEAPIPLLTSWFLAILTVFRCNIACDWSTCLPRVNCAHLLHGVYVCVRVYHSWIYQFRLQRQKAPHLVASTASHLNSIHATWVFADHSCTHPSFFFSALSSSPSLSLYPCVSLSLSLSVYVCLLRLPVRHLCNLPNVEDARKEVNFCPSLSLSLCSSNSALSLSQWAGAVVALISFTKVNLLDVNATLQSKLAHKFILAPFCFFPRASTASCLPHSPE